MWETIREVLISPNAISVLLFLLVCIIIAFVLIKTGTLQVHTDAVRIGAADIERNIIRNQLDYVRLHLDGIEGLIEKPEGYNELLGKFILEKVYDEYVDWITFNHLNKSQKYIRIKQERIASIVNHYTVKEEFKSNDFKNYICKDTEQVITDLIQIREIYKGGKV